MSQLDLSLLFAAPLDRLQVDFHGPTPLRLARARLPGAVAESLPLGAYLEELLCLQHFAALDPPRRA